MTPPTTLVVGTAGHIDHGKSALVKALTGTDPDRLKEERERGITIDLGFAHMTVGDTAVAFIDVPGHERFVRNMLAGAGGIDAVVLVVAADESVMPQTREHFEICRLLGIRRGIVALTKADLVDADTIELVTLEVRELVAGSFLESARVVPLSAKTGAGLDDLRAALAELSTTTPRQARAGVVRLPVDRVFSVRGFGTVVTGTLVSGRVAEEDELALLPEGRLVRVRGVQVHGRPIAAADAPRRVALNLGAVGVDELSRGVTLASPALVAATRRFDARIELLAGARPLRHGSRVRVHHGTSELPGRVGVSAVRGTPREPWRPAAAHESAVEVPPGGEAFVRIRLERPAVMTRLDRVVLRAYSPPVTIGGGVVLDPEPPSAGVRRPAALARFQQLDAGDVSAVWLAEAAERGLSAVDLVRRGGLDLAAAHARLAALVASGRAAIAGDRTFDVAAIEAIEARVSAALAAFHAAQPLESGMPRESLRDGAVRGASHELFDAVIAGLAARGVLGGADRLALASHRATMTPEEARAKETVEDLVRRAGLAPPDLASLAAASGATAAVLDRVVRWLVRERRIVRLDGLPFHADALSSLKARIQQLRSEAAGSAPVKIDVATFKSRFGLTRKHAIPLLEWLDRERVTRRVGDVRVVL